MSGITDMPHITNCAKCGKGYEELCLECFRKAQNDSIEEAYRDSFDMDAKKHFKKDKKR